jgi:hypothetical protein
VLGMTLELADFHHAIREDREPAATGLDGLRVVQVTLAMIGRPEMAGRSRSSR